MTDSSVDRRAGVLLLLGAVVGVALAALGIVRSGAAPRGVPADAVATVNGEPISRDAFAEFVGAVSAERKDVKLDAAEKARLLDRMVDEELLLQRGLELGLARYERTARRSIVAAVIAALTADAEAEEPSEAALRKFYDEESDRFRLPGRVAVDAAFVAAGSRPEVTAWQQASEIARRARGGEDLASLGAALGDPVSPPLPDGRISLDELRGALGPSAALSVERLEPGGVSDPVRGGAGYYVLRLRERDAGEMPRFEDVRGTVRAEYLRNVGERALVEHLRELRANAEIEIRLDEAPGS